MSAFDLEIEVKGKKHLYPRTVCRNCFTQAYQHLEGVCLFNTTLWSPMNQDEYGRWLQQRFPQHDGTHAVEDL